MSTSVVTGFGSWSAKPFAAVTLVAFLACLIAAQGVTARAIFYVSRDGVLPASSFLRAVDRRQVPLGALLPPKACPVDGEHWSGAYRYCPRHGKLLE